MVDSFLTLVQSTGRTCGWYNMVDLVNCGILQFSPRPITIFLSINVWPGVSIRFTGVCVWREADHSYLCVMLTSVNHSLCGPSHLFVSFGHVSRPLIFFFAPNPCLGNLYVFFLVHSKPIKHLFDTLWVSKSIFLIKCFQLSTSFTILSFQIP